MVHHPEQNRTYLAMDFQGFQDFSSKTLRNPGILNGSLASATAVVSVCEERLAEKQHDRYMLFVFCEELFHERRLLNNASRGAGL